MDFIKSTILIIIIRFLSLYFQDNCSSQMEAKNNEIVLTEQANPVLHNLRRQD